MSHELDTTTGREAIAYIGATPWHGLGFVMQPGAPLDEWQREAGLEWEARRGIVNYDRMILDVDGTEKPLRCTKSDSVVLYRNDSGTPLSIVSDKYKPVQPRQIIEFYRDLTEKHGFQIETAGALKNGKKIWALANTQQAINLKDDDKVKGYLLLATSFDGSMATQARFTAVRVVCNNTIEIAVRGAPAVSVSHNATFDADQVKVTLNIGDAWERFSSSAAAMTHRRMSQDETVKFFLSAYFGLTGRDQIAEAYSDEAKQKAMDKTIMRLTNALFNSPGSHLASARGTLWGALNAVTRDQDFTRPARSQENRLDAAWFGNGANTKQEAWKLATEVYL